MIVCEEELFWQLKDITQSKMPARTYFKKFFDERKEFHSSGELILFGGASCPWKGTLFELEEEQNCEGLIKFVFCQDAHGKFRVNTVPPCEGSFDQRISLHRDWRGLRNEELQAKSGVSDADFVHASGFLGAARSQAGALRMAQLSMEQHYKEQEEKAGK